MRNSAAGQRRPAVSANLSRAAGRAAEFRLAFDRAFAEPLRIDTAVKDDLLAIRVGGQACAIRLSEITGLFADKKVTRSRQRSRSARRSGLSRYHPAGLRPPDSSRPFSQPGSTLARGRSGGADCPRIRNVRMP